MPIYHIPLNERFGNKLPSVRESAISASGLGEIPGRGKFP